MKMVCGHPIEAAYTSGEGTGYCRWCADIGRLESGFPEHMVLYAFRYCLGRKSYAVGDCVDYLLSNWDRLSTNTINVIFRDIQEAFRDNRYGMEMDRQEWQKILDLKKGE